MERYSDSPHPPADKCQAFRERMARVKAAKRRAERGSLDARHRSCRIRVGASDVESDQFLIGLRSSSEPMGISARFACGNGRTYTWLVPESFD